MSIGEKLCNLRKKEGWSQSEFADKLCISRQTVSKWELNESLPDATNIVKISNLFKISTDYLLKDETEIIQKSNNIDKKRYYTLRGILITLSGIASIGVINIMGNVINTTNNNFTSSPFRSFVCNYGLEWIVYLSTTAIIIGISFLMRDIFINKSKKYKELKGKPLKLFIIFTILLIAITICCLWVSFELNLF